MPRETERCLPLPGGSNGGEWRWPREYAQSGKRRNFRPSALLWGVEWLDRAVEGTSPGESCFASVYAFTRLREPDGSPGGCVDYSSALVDTLFLDFDGPRSWEDAARFDAWARERGFSLRWYFSGSKGWHGYLDFLPWPGADGPALIRPAVSLLRDLTGCRSIDLAAADGPARLARVAGSVHPATGLRCVAADPSEPAEEVYRRALAPNGNSFGGAWGAHALANTPLAYVLLSLIPTVGVGEGTGNPHPAIPSSFAPPGAFNPLVLRGHPRGRRRLAALVLACRARAAGEEERSAALRVAEFASRCSPPLTEQEWRPILRYAYRVRDPASLGVWAGRQMV